MTDRSVAAKKAWVTRRRNATGAKLGIKKVKIFKAGAGKNRDAAKKAWDTRRKDDANAEAERQEALRILEEMGKQHEQREQSGDSQGI